MIIDTSDAQFQQVGQNNGNTPTFTSLQTVKLEKYSMTRMALHSNK